MKGVPVTQKFTIGQKVRIIKTEEVGTVVRYDKEYKDLCVLLVERLGTSRPVELLYSQNALEPLISPESLCGFNPGDIVESTITHERGRFVQLWRTDPKFAVIDVKQSDGRLCESRVEIAKIRKVDGPVESLTGPPIISPFKVGDRVELTEMCVCATITSIEMKTEDRLDWAEIMVRQDYTDTISGPWAPSELHKIESTVEPSSPLPPTQQQIDGDHYRKLKVDPVEFALANDLNCLAFSIVKHATRYPHKGEAVTDLKKVIHYAQIALERQYGVLSQVTYQEST
jgi:hypothetical protein